MAKRILPLHTTARQADTIRCAIAPYTSIGLMVRSARSARLEHRKSGLPDLRI